MLITSDRQIFRFRVKTPLLISFWFYIFWGAILCAQWKEGRKLGTPNAEKEYQYQYFLTAGLLGVSARRWTLSMTAVSICAPLQGYLVKRSTSTVLRRWVALMFTDAVHYCHSSYYTILCMTWLDGNLQVYPSRERVSTEQHLDSFWDTRVHQHHGLGAPSED